MSFKGAKLIAAGWAAFVLENLILSENRSEIIKKINDKNYHRIYNACSTASMAAVIYGYFRHGKNSILTADTSFKRLQPKGVIGKLAIFGLRLVGFGIFSQTLPKLQYPYKDLESSKKTVTQCPIDFSSDLPGRGIKRVTRHPTLLSFSMVTLSYALEARLFSSFVLLGMPLIVTTIGCLHQDSRYLRGIGGKMDDDEYQKSSFIPFIAFIRGDQNISDWINEVKFYNLSIASVMAFVSILF
jgi:uncharacterized membrane protein